jgi:hypothetical protein
MISSETVELLSAYVQELTSTAPLGWTVVDSYTEVSRDGDGGIDFLGMIVVSIEGLAMRDFVPSASEYFAMQAFFERCEIQGTVWTGMKLRVYSSGQYTSKFYYESTPLGDSNYLEAEQRLNSEP